MGYGEFRGNRDIFSFLKSIIAWAGTFFRVVPEKKKKKVAPSPHFTDISSYYRMERSMKILKTQNS